MENIHHKLCLDFNDQCLLESTSTKRENEKERSAFHATTTSKTLWICLDYLGYSRQMMQHRRNIHTKMDDMHNSYNEFSSITITTGGKAEGTALYFEGDIDRLYVAKNVKCVYSEQECGHEIMLQIDSLRCSPGYTRLKLVRPGFDSCPEYIQKAVLRENGQMYIANSFTLIPDGKHMVDINGLKLIKQEKCGPSIPYQSSAVKYDFVSGFCCLCPDLLSKWAQRVRQFEWPVPYLIEHIAKLEGYVVPVPNKCSKYPSTEWRICFTQAENVLMQSLSEQQTKLYILLKLLAKTFLKDICPDMTSYVMKNVIFWMVENNPNERFLREFLFDRLLDALIFLKDCIQSNVLKSYMIPERNLLQDRISEDQREKLLDKINSLLNEREQMFNSCDKLYKGIFKLKNSRDVFIQEAQKRNKIELLLLEKNIIFKTFDYPGQIVQRLDRELKQNTKYMQIEEQLYQMVLPDKDKFSNSTEVFRERLMKILS